MLQQVKSTNIDSVGYIPSKLILVVKFHSGKIYSYQGVPTGVYDSFINASSKGKYLNSQIKGSYLFEDITNKDLATYLGVPGATKPKKTRKAKKTLTFEQLIQSMGGRVQAFF